jgi:rhodanese-related sulfurtransferase
MLYEEAVKAKVPVSLATIYNTLHQFTDVGLLRQIAVDGSKTYFDTNVSQHHHFFIEGENALVDIPHSQVVIGRTPIPPEGYESKNFTKDKTIILYCASGGRSALGGKVLKEMGYGQVYNLGAFKDWAEGGGSVDKLGPTTS